MAPRVIRGFSHVPGVHCGSTALADVVRHHGLPFSEPMCFGLGAGLAFYFLPGMVTPSRMFLGRTASMEEDFCRIVGLSFSEQTESDDALAWERVKDRVDQDFPVILSTDLRFLPYYRTSTAFNGHRIVLAGYDEEKQAALVADTEREGLQEVPLEALTRARTSDGPPAGFNYSPWWEIGKEVQARPLEEMVPEALRLTADRALDDVSGFGGCDALERMAAEMPEWPKLEDFRYLTRYGYGVIEKRGTGGALFRALYARFFEEAAKAAPTLPLQGLAERMGTIAGTWVRFAGELKALSDGGKEIARAAETAREIAAEERGFFEEIRRRL